jgi:Lar family restriction alleviation protein
MATELKPCPFCGGTDIRKLTTIIGCDILCRNCGATIQRTNFIVGNALAETLVDAEPEAIKAWNRRAEDDSM